MSTRGRWTGVIAVGVTVGLLTSAAMGGLALDIRLTGTGEVAIPIVAPGQIVVMDLWAIVTGADTNPANDGLNKFYAAFYSTDGGLVKGNMSVEFAAGNPLANNPYPGAMVDLDGDGDLDIGATDPATASGWFLAKANTGQMVLTPARIAHITFAGYEWGDDPHGITQIWAVGRGQAIANIWREDGVNKTGIPATGQKVTLYRPADVVEGPPLLMAGPGMMVTFDAGASLGSINRWAWDFNGDGIYDIDDNDPRAQNPVVQVPFEYLVADLGMEMGRDYPVMLRTRYILNPVLTEDEGQYTTLHLFPEPATMALMLGGLGCGLALRRRRAA